MVFFNGSNAQNNPNRGVEYYNDIKKGELELKYESDIRSVTWYHVFFSLGAVALVVGLFLIFA